jgi:hypothetical protein
MKNISKDEAIIRQLEESLLLPNVRCSVNLVSEILADDFVEFGSSGYIFNKKQVIEGLQQEDSRYYSLFDFRTTHLCSDIILVTYCAVKKEISGQNAYSLRSSVWKLVENRWQMIFHQGTPTVPRIST